MSEGFLDNEPGPGLTLGVLPLKHARGGEVLGDRAEEVWRNREIEHPVAAELARTLVPLECLGHLVERLLVLCVEPEVLDERLELGPPAGLGAGLIDVLAQITHESLAVGLAAPCCQEHEVTDVPGTPEPEQRRKQLAVRKIAGGSEQDERELLGYVHGRLHVSVDRSARAASKARLDQGSQIKGGTRQVGAWKLVVPDSAMGICCADRRATHCSTTTTHAFGRLPANRYGTPHRGLSDGTCVHRKHPAAPGVDCGGVLPLGPCRSRPVRTP